MEGWEKTESWIAELLSDLGEIRKDECKEREDAWEKERRKEYSGAVLLRLRGFLHALRLVEMTTKKSTVISSVVERSPSLWYEQRCLSRRFFGFFKPSE